MTFIGTYGEAMRLLRLIGKGQLTSGGKNSWIANLRYALKTKTNPLNLTPEQRKKMEEMIKVVSKRNSFNKISKSIDKYKNRKSPPFPANAIGNKNKIKKGNDGLKYKSIPDKNGIYKWKKLPESEQK